MNIFNMQCNFTKLVLLLLMNIIIDFSYLISGIYTNFRWLMCARKILRHYPWCDEVDDYRLVFIVSILLLRKILNAC